MSEQFKLAQFTAFRDEIAQRSGYQQTLIGLTVTSVGAVAGFVLGSSGHAIVLLVIPYICFGLGMLWYDHAINIDRIALAKNKLERELGGGDTTYEKSVRQFERSRIPPRVFPLGMLLLVLFFAAPTISLVLTFHSVRTAAGALAVAYWALWVLGVVAVVVETVIISRWAWPPRAEP